MKKVKLGYLVSHPIQYQAPLLKLIAAQPWVKLKVYFCSDFSLKDYSDEGFGKKIKWDVPLTDGYDYSVLPSLAFSNELSFFKPVNYGLKSHLIKDGIQCLWIHGWGYWSHVNAVRIANKLNIPVLMRGESGFHVGTENQIKQKIKNIYLKYVFKKISGFLSIGSRNTEYYRAFGVPDEKIYDVPYAVDNKYFQNKVEASQDDVEKIRNEFNIKKDIPVFLYASKLSERKCILDLLSAYSQLSIDGKQAPAAYLLIVGDGEEFEKAEAVIKSLQWDTVKLLGFKNQSELPSYYALCDVFVLPSKREAWGLVVNEVMNASKSVVVTNEVGCADDLVLHGENGYVYQAGNIKELSALLKNYINDRSLASRMGKESLKIITDWGFDQDIVGLQKAIQDVTK